MCFKKRQALRALTPLRYLKYVNHPQAIEEVLKFAVYHLKNHAFPTVDEQYQDAPQPKKLRSALTKGNQILNVSSPLRWSILSGQKADDDEEETPKKSRKKTGAVSQYTVLSKFNLFSRLCAVWECFSKLVQKTALSVTFSFLLCQVPHMRVAGSYCSSNGKLQCGQFVHLECSTVSGEVFDASRHSNTSQCVSNH